MRGLLGEADAAFAAGDAERWADLFEEDGRMFLLHREALVGRAAIYEFWQDSSARVDTSDWNPVTDLVEVHGDHAYAFRTYLERLRNREDGSRTLVRGRLIYFLRRDPAAAWRIRLLMNSHSHPLEPIQ
ncbi:MAG: YybH family protein [Candidatus Limnocylindria bacterium]